MTIHSIPVDISNPGHVFACIGILEILEKICGHAEGGFEFGEGVQGNFCIATPVDENPIDCVLSFLINSDVYVLTPIGYKPSSTVKHVPSIEFPAPSDSKSEKLSDNVLPVVIESSGKRIILSHWLGGDGRLKLKSFAGQQRSYNLISNMIFGDPKRSESTGIKSIYESGREILCKKPFSLYPVGGRFGFDAQGSWDSQKIGNSLDKLGALIQVSPCVEILAAIGLEYARPEKISDSEKNVLQYNVWLDILPLNLCRVAIGSSNQYVLCDRNRCFEFELIGDYYKKFNFAMEVVKND